MGGQTKLVYDVNVTDGTCPTILEKPSSWLWYEDAVIASRRCRVAYLYLLLIESKWKRQGVGTAYIFSKATALGTFGIDIIYLEASYEGPRFWSKQGFEFVDPERFWVDYAEYCDHYEISFQEDMDQVPDEFFEYLRKSSFSYPMYRRLQPC
ncbi:hypothetical protein OU994_27855 [Pseudoduganella sp. SL102]|uniref:hypothetical protein n=1 Tax=Pseudoduganella sp. SL102 TaxID=2995154 RepID=UPI00248C6BF1|nr:hypothetical protein [Pseudoduganella sp. SL102]WBS02024.1 hypothetical protein OU994_27855 [Pseudoduganella sp. SL102]